MSKHTRKWKLSCMNVIDTGHGSITVQQDCHPDDAFDRDVREWLEKETKFVMDACNALAGIPDPAAYIKAMREVCEAADKYISGRKAGFGGRSIASLLFSLCKAVDALRTLSTPESEPKPCP